MTFTSATDSKLSLIFLNKYDIQWVRIIHAASFILRCFIHPYIYLMETAHHHFIHNVWRIQAESNILIINLEVLWFCGKQIWEALHQIELTGDERFLEGKNSLKLSSWKGIWEEMITDVMKWRQEKPKREREIEIRGRGEGGRERELLSY